MRGRDRTPSADLAARIGAILRAPEEAASQASRVAEAIRLGGNYRWVGLYAVGEEEIAVLAWSGPGGPMFPRFPVTQGLNGAAVSSRSSIVVNDVTKDHRYLTTFDGTRSEIVVPVFHARTGEVIATIDVESDQADAFTEADRRLLETCAVVVARMWR